MFSKDDWTGIVGLATHAPSIHNTQPWRFVVAEGSLRVYADRSRSVPVIDPIGRQRMISLGAAVEFAHLAVQGMGAACLVLPPGSDADADLVATLTPYDDPAAVDPAAAQLAAAIPRRHTDRSPFDARPIPDGLFAELRGGIEALGAVWRPLERREDELAAADLLAYADEVQRANPAYREEIALWVRKGDSVEGIVPEVLPDERPADRVSQFRVRDFSPEPDATAHPDAGLADPADPAPPIERQSVVLLGTPYDDSSAWLVAGRAMGWLLLALTVRGLAASPLTQVLDVARARQLLAQQLGLVSHPQMLLRVGYPTGSVGVSPRRPVEEVLTFG